MTKDPGSVFVVHGRNESLRKSMFDFLRSIGLKPVEWTQAVELTGDGSPYVGQVLDAAFEHAQAVVVLLTPDEVAYMRPDIAADPLDPETQPAMQARPNVLFEAGMAFGHNAKHTVLVEVGTMRAFSDVGGRHLVRLTNEVKQRQALAQRLKTAGCSVDISGTDWHTVGDFSPPPAPGGGLQLGRRVPSATNLRPPTDFSLKYHNKGGNQIDKLQVINRGLEAAYDVSLSVPDDAAIDLSHATLPIPKIPGGGNSVTIDALSHLRYFGGHDRQAAFDVTVTGHLESGQVVSQEVFIDMNG
jgi:hypothetical protein